MTNRKRRSLFAAGLAGLASFAVRAAAPAGRTITLGMLHATGAKDGTANQALFDSALRQRGYVEGRNLVYKHRFADFESDRLPALAAELAALNVDIIIAGGTPPTLAAQAATTRIPIIGVGITAPTVMGMGASMRQPGSNITGITNLAGEVTNKGLEVLRALVPRLRRVGWIFNPHNPASANGIKGLEAKSATVGLTLVPVSIERAEDVDHIDRASNGGLEAIYIPLDSTLNTLLKRFATVSLDRGLPAMGSLRRFVEEGGLASYGHSYAEQWANTAEYVDRIANGAKAGELPFMQPTRFELALNRTTADKLRLKIPADVLLRAEVLV